jgi:hypothetical protein
MPSPASRNWPGKSVSPVNYAHICSRPRADAFGGSAHVLDLRVRKSIGIGWISAREWLAAVMSGEDIAAAGH